MKSAQCSASSTKRRRADRTGSSFVATGGADVLTVRSSGEINLVDAGTRLRNGELFVQQLPHVSHAMHDVTVATNERSRNVCTTREPDRLLVPS